MRTKMKTVNEKLREEITEHERIEEVLRESDYQGIIRTTTDGFWVLDSKGRFLDVNDAYCALTGYSREELLNMSIPDIEAVEKPEEVAQRIRRIMKTGHARFETRHRCKDGRIVDIEISTTYAGAGDGRFFVFARDITERKQAEEALQAEKNKLQSLVDAMEDGIGIRDRDYNIIYQNEPARIIFGDHLGEKCYRVYEGREEVCEGCPVEKAFRDGKSHTSERRVVTPSGEVTFLENTANPVRDAKGRIVSCLEINRNITERKRMEEALLESEERFRSIVENSQAGIMIVDESYRFTYVNDELCRIAGYSREEVIGQDFRQFLDEESKQLVADRYIRRQRGEEFPPRYEFNFVRKDGQKRRVEISSAVIRDSAGKVKTVAQILDITERKQAEEALRESQEKLRRMFESVTDGISVIDLNGVITEVNPRTVEIHGFASKDELVGRSALELIAPRDHEKIVKNMRQALKQGTVKDVEYTLLRADGSEFPGELSTSVLKDASGKPIGHITIARDITERKQVERALRQAKEQFQTLVEESPLGVAMFTKDGHYQYINPKFIKMFGYTLEDFSTRQEWFAKVYPDQQCRKKAISTWEADTKAAEHGERPEQVFTMTCKDGSEKAIYIRPVILETGDYLVIYEDITERKQMEQALRESEEKFSKAFRSSPSDSITLTRLNDGLFIEVNENFLRTTGYTREEVINHTSNEVGVWAKEEDRARMVQMLKEQGRVHNEKFDFRMKSGEIREALFSAELIDIGGEPCVISMNIDISRLRKAEWALRQAKEQFQALVEESPLGVALITRDGRYQYVNPKFVKMFGYTLEEVPTGREWFAKAQPDPEYRKQVISAWKEDTKAAEHGERPQRVFNVTCKDGSEKVIYFRTVTLETGDYLVIYEDITERKQAEEREKRLQQELYLAQRLASIGELAAGVAHEINNPLTGVLGFSQRLLRKSKDEELSRDLEIIHGEAQRAAKVVQNLLTFARRREPKKEYSNINDIVQKALELRGYALQTGNIEVMTDLAPSLPQIMVDFPQIQEVFLNIILNAEHAMNEANGGGKLIIKTREVKDYVRISFADDGPGIPPEQLAKVFDPFFTTRAEKGGTGLGLSACHGTVTKHGGRIYIRSKPGKGATFFVELPLSLIETTVGRRAQ